MEYTILINKTPTVVIGRGHIGCRVERVSAYGPRPHDVQSLVARPVIGGFDGRITRRGHPCRGAAHLGHSCRLQHTRVDCKCEQSHTVTW